MAMFLLRVELPDRPGALGAVASRIGAVRADVVAVDIVGRDEGRAVDEFVVELADENHVSLLLSEIAEVDGVEIEELRILPAAVTDRRYDAYDTAEALMREHAPNRVLAVVAERARHELNAQWSAVLDVEERQLVASAGRPPAAPWLAAYVEGTRWHRTRSGEPSPPEDGGASATAHRPAPDVAWVDLSSWDLALVVGRPGWSFGEDDRRRLAAVARLGDCRWTDLAENEARLLHPSRVG